VESLGAVVFFHQCGPTLVKARTARYALPNSIGNLVDRAVTFGTLVFGGVMDRYPELKICLGHAGGYAPFGVARMDKTWRAADMGVPEFVDAKLRKPPSEYLSRFYYDSCTYTEDTLRFLIDAVGIDRVVLGTDYPAPMVQEDPVGWLEKMPGISEAERTAILETNPASMLGLLPQARWLDTEITSPVI
jgi:aminocarboxymuconate-semialdehyde decarboxylase